MLTVGLFGIPDTTYDGSATYTHDHGLALMREGVVLTTIELERYTGRKHDNRLGQFIGELLAPWLRPGEDVRFVSANSFVGNTFISNDGNLRVEPASQVGIDEILYPARCVWYPDGLHPRPAEAWIIAHEFAHVAAALPFCSSFPENALLVHVDGGASRSACSFWHWKDGQARCLHHAWDDLKDVVNNFNVSPLARAILNEPTSAHLALPGKLMGYAAHGRCDDPTYAWLKENRWFLDYAGSEADLLHRVNSRRAKPATRFDTHDAGFMNLAAGLQRAFEEAVVETILGYARRVGSRHLVYAGGAALNITTNRLLVESGQFESIFIPPPANDAGLALGAAAWVEFLERGRLAPHGPFLNRFGLDDPDADVQADVDEVAQAIVAGQVVGIATGGAEIGPRALGHRSLLARADDPELRRHVSEQIKKREWYRPIAPVLCESAARVALGTQAAEASISRYMLGSWTVRDDFATGLAGVLHHDGTVRAQVVPSDDPDNRFLDRLLRLLWEQHGLPGLINTSFNVKGQPIVQRPEDAVNLGRQMGLDAVVLPDRLVRL